MFKIGVVEFECGHDSGGATYGTQTVYRVEINPGSLAEANAMRWQMLGQKDKIVAVVWDDDPMVNGMYIQRDCSVSPIANYLAHGRMSVNVVLERVPNIIEAAYTQTERTGGWAPNSHRAYGIHAYPNGLLDEPTWAHDNGGLVMSDYDAVYNRDGGNSRMARGLASFVDGKSFSVQQACDPEYYHNGSCRIEVNGGDDAGWWVLTGKTVPEGHDIRITNDRIRVQPVTGTNYMLLEVWDSPNLVWQQCARYTYGMRSETGGEFTQRFNIRRNDHASVEVTCSQGWTVDHKLAFLVDLKMLRGWPSCWALLRDGPFGDAAVANVGILEYDGSNMAVSSSGSGAGLVRTSAIGVVTPGLFAEDTGITLSTTTDDATSTSTSGMLVGMGRNADAFKLETQIADRVVY